jgi:DNA-binding response OmpR family regulator
MIKDLSKYFKGKSILIVDDDYVSALLLEEFLKHLNTKILVAYSVKDARRLFKENNGIALVMLDIKLSDGNAYELGLELKAVNPNIIIIAQTALANEDEKIKLDKSCFNDYIFKPISEDILHEAISRHILDI